MPSTPTPRPAPAGLGDLLSLFGANNPLSAMSRSVEQFRTGVTSFIEVVQSFRETMDNLNEVAKRMNRMLDDLEEPLHTVMPQVTRSADAASRMLATLREPVERAAPALVQLADTLNNPLVVDLPRRLNETMDVLGSIPRALGPLGQVADLAGGFFGGRGLGAFGTAIGRSGARAGEAPEGREVVEAVEVEPEPPRRSSREVTHTAPSAQDTFRRSAAKHPAARQQPATQTTAKKTTARKTTAKKVGASKKVAASKKAAPRNTAARTASPRATAKKDTAGTRSGRSATRG